MSVEFCEENSDRSKKMHYFRENCGGGGGAGHCARVLFNHCCLFVEVKKAKLV